jgi:deoxycytidine triphosphate deaminase
MSEPQPPSDGAQIPEDFAATSQEAKERYDQWVNRDPFPRIPSALLNSADVYDYVRATGMIQPFDPKFLKASSYEIAIGGRYIYWDQDGKNHDFFMDEGEEFLLHPNSIGFVTTKEYFRLPHYIGARFNLRITNVHRGILLGTGPLVDPGFLGQLLVPLHNLTTNKYVFRSGERFAWFEFTKVSPNIWSPDYVTIKQIHGLRGDYVPFPQSKIDTAQDHRKYLAKAWPGAIRSSIPEVVTASESSAKQARHDAEKARSDASTASEHASEARTAAEGVRATLYRIGWIAVIGVVIGVVALIYSSWQLITDVSSSVADVKEQQALLESRIPDDVAPDVAVLSSELNRIAEDVRSLARALGTPDSSVPAWAQLDELRALLNKV